MQLNYILPPVPSTPTNLAVRPVYNRDGHNFIIQYIDVEFTGVVSNVILYMYNEKILRFVQDEVDIGGGLPSTINYTVLIGSQDFSGIICNVGNNRCSQRINVSHITSNELLNISVVASNVVGSGNSVSFPTLGMFVFKNNNHCTHCLILQLLQILGQLLIYP